VGKPSKMTADERSRIVVAVLRNEMTAVEAARRHGVSEQSIHNWKAAFLEGGRARLAAHEKPQNADREAALQAKVDELSRELDDARTQLRVFGREEVRLPPSQTSR
jgi:transposase-like protein